MSDSIILRILNDIQSQCTVFYIEVVLSLKSSNYQVHIVIHDETGEFLPSPVSRCFCPAGQLFYSHMLGCLIILAAFQSKDEWSPADFLRVLPEQVGHIQAISISITDSMVANFKKNRESRHK